MAKKYNEIEAKDNMKVDNNGEETMGTPEKKDIKKVLGSQPKKLKRGLMNRLVTGILGPEGLPGIGAYVNEEIIKPAVKNIIVEGVTSAINMLMYRGEGPPRGGGHHHMSHSRNRTIYRPGTDYAKRYNTAQPEPAERRVARSSRHGVEEYVIEDRFDAAHVLTSLKEHADMYDVVSVADYYDSIGVPSEYTDHSYGWTIDSIIHATIVPIRGGYIIKLPPVEVI